MDNESETRTIKVEVDVTDERWLDMTAREYGLSVEKTAEELLHYGLIHHEHAIDN